ncbi:uncharacterized protein KY384_003988 [Bacidia gigantensis]|uniref:uncharacterized protein n=1 Tax=Bacidia gigantensis TaxID=2732470 RepID=UPI001D04109E|nr:uncharacterized protein KY384_003988 [Bacidia gigantensis]KAG8531277.1 hypothetical protein KY384_003988 [Bacidia gigantensis]
MSPEPNCDYMYATYHHKPPAILPIEVRRQNARNFLDRLDKADDIIKGELMKPEKDRDQHLLSRQGNITYEWRQFQKNNVHKEYVMVDGEMIKCQDLIEEEADLNEMLRQEDRQYELECSLADELDRKHERYCLEQAKKQVHLELLQKDRPTALAPPSFSQASYVVLKKRKRTSDEEEHDLQVEADIAKPRKRSRSGTPDAIPMSGSWDFADLDRGMDLSEDTDTDMDCMEFGMDLDNQTPQDQWTVDKPKPNTLQMINKEKKDKPRRAAQAMNKEEKQSRSPTPDRVGGEKKATMPLAEQVANKDETTPPPEVEMTNKVEEQPVHRTVQKADKKKKKAPHSTSQTTNEANTQTPRRPCTRSRPGVAVSLNLRKKNSVELLHCNGQHRVMAMDDFAKLSVITV